MSLNKTFQKLLNQLFRCKGGCWLY